jgi:ribosomal protein S18 acetylase RimI-like enzyme
MENSDFLIRKATREDSSALSELSFKLNSTFNDNTRPDPDFIRDNWDNNIAYVAESEGKLVGFLAGSKSCQMHLGRNRFEVQSLYVEPEFRKHGIGKALLDKLVLDTEELGVGKITLQVHNDNKSAIEFYKSSSFKEAGYASNYKIFDYYP